MLSAAEVTWDKHDRLAGDLHCVKCGHNLRGLARVGECGECGTPVQLSLVGNYMFDRDPQWVGSLRVGVQCLCVTLVWLWFPPAWLIVGYGLWRVTASDPGAPSEGRRSTIFLRILLAASLPLIWIGAFPAVYVYWMEYGFQIGVNPQEVVFGFACGVWLFTPLIYAVVLRRIGALSDDKRMKQSLDNVLWLSILAIPLAACGAVEAVTKLGYEALIGLAALGVLSWILACCRLVPTMLRLWRFLDIAETQATSRRTQARYWRGPVPGAASSPGQQTCS